LGTRHFFAPASRIHWERRLPAGRPSRAGLSVTPTTRAAIVSRLEAGAPSRYDACFGDQREKVARTRRAATDWNKSGGVVSYTQRMPR